MKKAELIRERTQGGWVVSTSIYAGFIVALKATYGGVYSVQLDVIGELRGQDD
jgi:hypothetical protein